MRNDQKADGRLRVARPAGIAELVAGKRGDSQEFPAAAGPPRAALAGAAAANHVPNLLEKIPGVAMRDASGGSFQFGTRRARLLIASDESIQVCWPARGGAATDFCPLSLNHQLAGNARIALGRTGMCVLADTQCDGQRHLPRTFGELQHAFRLAADALSGRQSAADLPADRPQPRQPCGDRVEPLLSALGWNEDAIVRGDNGWELRPRLHGESFPVWLACHGEQLGVTRLVLKNMPRTAGPRRAALVDHAMRTNARLRGVRLAMNDGHLVAESRLHAEQWEASWLASAAYAVATTARLVRTVLRVLVEQPDVARRYVEVFGIEIPNGPADGSAGDE